MKSTIVSAVAASVLLAVSSFAFAGPFDMPPAPRDPELQALEMARAHLQQGEAARAVEVLQNALTERPNSARLRHHLGVALVRDGKPEPATEQFRNAIELDRQFPDPHIELAHLSLRRIRPEDEQDRATNLGLVEDAINHYQSALNKTPRALRTRLYYNLAQLHLESIRFRDENPEQGFDQAVEILLEAREQADDETRPHMTLGNVRVQYANYLAGDQPVHELAGEPARKANELLDQALGHYRRALEINPRFLDAVNRIARVYQIRGETDQAVAAIADHMAKLEQAEERALCFRWKGEYRRLADELEQAKGHFESAIETYPGELTSYLLLANVHIESDNAGEAVAVLTQATEARPQFVNAHIELGILEERRGNRARAAEHFQAALNIPTSRAAFIARPGQDGRQTLAQLYLLATNRLAEIHLAGGHEDEAVRVYRNLADLLPGSPVPSFQIGQIHRRFGRMEQAREQFENALQLDSNYVPARAALADLEALTLQEATTPEERAEVLRRVIDQYELALETQSANPEILDRLAVLHARLAYNTDPMDREEMGRALEYSRQAAEASIEPRYRRRLASIHHELGQTDEAVAQINRIIEQIEELKKEHPDSPRLVFDLGDLQALLHRWGPDEDLLQSALASYGEAVEMAPSFIEPYVRAGRLLEGEQRHEESVVWYKRMLEAARGETPLEQLPDDRARAVLHASAQLAWVYVEYLDDTETAMRYARIGTQIDPNLASLVDTIGWIHYKDGDYEEALTYLRRAARDAPTNPTVRYHLGATLARTGDNDRAREELREALNHVDDDETLTGRINALLEELGN